MSAMVLPPNASAGRQLWQERPPWLSERIKTSFEAVANPEFRGYHILGSTEYAFGNLAGSDLVGTCLRDSEDAVNAAAAAAAPSATMGGPSYGKAAASLMTEPFRLLDVGAGEGRFLERMRSLRAPGSICTVGVSAQVYDAALASMPNAELRCVNAECLLETVSFQGELRSSKLYDLILSAESFRHFQDPLGTLAQLFQLLRPGGVLAVDRLNVSGLGSGQRLLDWWKSAGFEVSGEASGERIAPLLLRKGSSGQTLSAPIRYRAQQPKRDGTCLGDASGGDSDGAFGATYEFNGEERVLCASAVLAQAVNAGRPGGGLSGKRSTVAGLSPPWDRVQQTTEAPKPQWRQMEELLKQLTAKRCR